MTDIAADTATDRLGLSPGVAANDLPLIHAAVMRCNATQQRATDQIAQAIFGQQKTRCTCVFIGQRVLLRIGKEKILTTPVDRHADANGGIF